MNYVYFIKFETFNCFHYFLYFLYSGRSRIHYTTIMFLRIAVLCCDQQLTTMQMRDIVLNFLCHKVFEINENLNKNNLTSNKCHRYGGIVARMPNMSGDPKLRKEPPLAAFLSRI